MFNTRRLGRRTITCIVMVAIALALKLPASAQRPPAGAAPARVERHASPDQVDRAIKRAQQYLLANLGRTDKHGGAGGGGGGFSADDGHWVGTTSLACYALIVSGIPADDPRLARALDGLRRANTRNTYALGLRSLLWSEARQLADQRALVTRDGNVLVSGSNPDGLYGYSAGKDVAVEDKILHGAGGYYDHSCSNYGTMGAWAAAEAGMPVGLGYWRKVNTTWRNHQADDGSWSYHAPGAGSPSMTAGGLVTLFITQQWIERLQPRPDPADPPRDRRIDSGVSWLADNFGGLDPYTLFNIQRVGLNSGYKYFRKVDWYQNTVDRLIARQGATGDWGGVLGTGWTLSFVALGRAPVVLNKLQYRASPDVKNDDWEGWQQRPRDAANLADWFGRKNKMHFNWQIVELDMTLETLHDSPILYLSGEREFKFSQPQLDTLRRYVEEGGLILGNANGASKLFSESFTKLGESLFPQYQFRELPPDHPIYLDQRFNKSGWKRKLSLRGLGNGSREFMLLFPLADPARAWQMMKPSFDEKEWTNGRDEEFELGANIISYAIERSKPRYKGETWLVEQLPGLVPNQEVVVARLEYDGNWDPEPFGWEQLSRTMLNERNAEVALARVKLGEGQLDARFPVSYLTGTGKLQLTEKQRQELKRYAYESGLLIVDACGGSPEFAESAEAELQAIFGEPTKLLTSDHPIYTSAVKLREAQYRQAAEEKLKVELKMPRLRGIERDGKLVAILSPQDLSTALVGHTVDGVVGYRPEYATKLMVNILTFAGRPQK